jgi:hypothetical protein
MRELTSDMTHRAATEYANWLEPDGAERDSERLGPWLAAYERATCFMPAALAAAFGISSIRPMADSDSG